MSRLRTPARGRLRGQNALSKRPGRFERPESQALDDSSSLEEEAGSSAAAGAPERASGLIVTDAASRLPFAGHCLAGDTPILMADGTTRSLAALKAGDAIIGTVREGGQRRYVKTQVLARWSVIQPAIRILLEDGTEVIAGGGHRFLTTRGWKVVSGSADADPASDLRTGDRLLGTGAFAQAPAQDLDYRRAYLCGLFRGYACPEPRTPGRVRLAQRDPAPLIPCSGEAWERAERWLREWRTSATPPPRVPLAMASGAGYPVQALPLPVVCPHYEEIQDAIHWPVSVTPSWCAGFLGGIFDASGSYEGGVLRICHPDAAVIGRIGEALRVLNIARRLELVKQTGRSPIAAVRVDGGFPEQLRFFHRCDPAIAARRDIAGQLVTSSPCLAVVAIERLRIGRRLHDITTGTGDFVANGLVSHNWDPRLAPAGGMRRETCLPGTPDAIAARSGPGPVPGQRPEGKHAILDGPAGSSAPMPMPIRPQSRWLRRDAVQPRNLVELLGELRAARVPDGMLVVPAIIDDEQPPILTATTGAAVLRAECALTVPQELLRGAPTATPDISGGWEAATCKTAPQRHLSTIDALSLLTML